MRFLLLFGLMLSFACNKAAPVAAPPPPPPPVAKAKEEPKKAPEQWTKVRVPTRVTIDGIEFNFKGMKTGKVDSKALELIPELKAELKDDTVYTTLDLVLTNKMEGKKLEFESLGSSGTTVEDDRGNKYKLASNPLAMLEVLNTGSKPNSLYPDRPQTDAIVFEELLKGAKHVRFRIPKKKFGQEGEMLLQVELW